MGAQTLATLLILCNAGTLASQVFYSTVPSLLNCGDLAYKLPTNDNIEYRKNYTNSDLEANRFSLTKDGSLLLQTPLWDLHDRRIQLGVISKNRNTGERSQHNILLKIVNAKQEQIGRITRSIQKSRWRRAAEVSLTATVSEATSNEIVLDYASVGVIKDSNNKFYMLPDDSLPFSGVDLVSGRLIIYPNRKLDYETAPNKRYQPIVFINNTANGNEYRVSVTINLEDVNDESPRFTMQPIPYLAAFKANLAAGTKVDYGITVNDPDANSALRYSLLEGGANFQITQNAELFTTTSLVNGIEYRVKVEVRDTNAQPAQTAEAEILVLVGRRPPQFYQPNYETSVPENVNNIDLDVIIKVKSFQGDIIAFSMTDSQYFSIEESAARPNEAKIRLTSKLNYETEDHRSHTLVITARERGTALSSTAQVIVTLTDINDNAPRFDISEYVGGTAFQEDSTEGTLITTVKATDIDPPNSANGRITYSLQSDSADPLPFSVETVFDGTSYKGDIKISGKLDYESIDSIGYRFKVIATDAGQPPKSSSAYVRVNVQNTNDEAPRFESTRLERIEATKAVDSVVTTVLASDPDGDKVSYQIVSSQPASPFRIDPDTGSVYLTADLTQSAYRDKSSFTLNVSATDDGSCCQPDNGVRNTGYSLVIIEIVGRNHAPEFPNCTLFNSLASAPENTNNAFVIQVKAKDEDVGPNGELRYSLIVNDVSLFRIDETTGDIYTTVSSIDREATSQISITVKAEDGAQSKLSTFCTFTMQVRDQNDNDPVLNLPNSQNVVINSPIGTTIYPLFAVDPDFGNNGTAGLTYQVLDNDNFMIENQALKNKVKLTSALNPTQTMRIRVVDGGGRSKIADFTVNIRQDAAPPVFTRVPPDDFKILENLTDDTIIYRIKAISDEETRGPVNYYLVPQTTLEAFHILTDNQECNDNNELCLAIYKSQKLDADELRFYKLQVRVTPQSLGNNVYAERTINVELIDVNDNIPVFENTDDNGYVIGSVDENTTVINTEVVTVKAYDSDITPAFKTKTYSLEPNLDSALFSVESLTGIVRVAQDIVFDRETRDLYQIKVKAIDGSPSARPQADGQPNSQIVTVQININDINDNPPFFPEQQYDGRVEETAPKGKLVMNVRASDADINNNFQYSLPSGNDNQAFEITNTGDIVVFDTGRLDYETKKVYNMVVEVSDGRYSAQTNVYIELIDMNDNIPQFTQSVYSVSSVYEEDDTISTSNRLPIVKVTATDADIDRPNNIQYALSGSYSDRFQIDLSSGQVYLVRSLDRDTQPQWDVNVLAYDEPGTPTNRIGYAIVSVFPQDINDNYPVFREESLTGTVMENLPLETTVMTIQANDKDAGNNGSVKFRLKENSVQPQNYPASNFYPYFEIDELGVVKTIAEFDREVVDSYTLEVVAYDLGTPSSKSTTATATIIVGDDNDNAPEFVPDYYARQVSELAGPLSFIVKVNVEDLDSDAVFAFSLDNAAAQNFSIDDQGNIFIRDQQRLDFEHFYLGGLSPQMNITVDVSDGRMSDKATVQITVLDENDETPLFDPQTVTVNLLENITVNTLVHTFTATDRDAISTPRNSEIEYLIDRTASSDFDRYFKVDPSNGQVRTQKALDRETLETHTVKILAVDNGFPSRRTGTATLNVNLEDINDNGPRLVDPVVYIEENMPINSHTRPREIRAIDDDDNKVGHGPPFMMAPSNGSANSKDLRFVFHTDWDVPSGLTVANGAGELLTRRELDREGEQGPEIKFYLELTDKENVSAVRSVTVVVADEDDNPPSPGHRDALVYNYKGDYQVVEIGDCYAIDADDWDKPYKSYEKVGSWPNGFSIDGNTGMMSADLRVIPSGVYEFKCKVIDMYIADTRCAFQCNEVGGTPTQVDTCKDSCRVRAEAISTVKATIKTIDEAPVWNGASIRLKGTALEFLTPQSDGRSSYDKFMIAIADSLNTKVEYVDVFSVLDSESAPGFVDVRFTAHGSPYYNTTKLIGAVLADGNFGYIIGMEIGQVPINECLKEVCEGGCTNTLSIADGPTLVNANGSSLVGVTSVVMAQCGCDIDDGSSPLVCTPDSCLHGGTCIYNEDSKTTGCECPFGFDGPRCQQIRHSFTGNGWAEYNTLPQCGNGSTIIEVITRQSNGLILYNGPRKNPGTGIDAITDYIAITVSSGRPVVYVDYGTGFVSLTVTKAISDGKWHKLEISKVNRDVTLTLDDCSGGQIPDSDTSQTTGRSSCQQTKTTPGENRFLNVDTLLELGGRSLGQSAWYPSEITSASRQAYDGCIRNLKHNGELYDLHIGNQGSHSNTQDGCPREDSICLNGNGEPVCGKNGICEAQLGDNTYQCTCKPGWSGKTCNTATEFMDFSSDSFVEWQSLSLCQTASQCQSQSYNTDIQLSFRSRDEDNSGLLFLVKGDNGAEYIKLQIVQGQLQLRYDIGSDNVDINRREQTVTLPVTVTDGDLHHVTVSRVGKLFKLSMDGGEGRYFAQHEDVYSHQLFSADGKFYAGADGSYTQSGNDITASTDLANSCITDIRFNGKTFPVNLDTSSSSDVTFVRRQNVAEGCTSDGCLNVNCPGRQLCFDLWRDFDCRCPGGYLTLYTTPYCENINECFPDNPCLNGDCVDSEGSFSCDCYTIENGRSWSGDFCSVAPSSQKSVLKLSNSGIVALFIALLLVVVIAVGIFCWVTRRSSIRKGETLIDPYDDIRETIYNYDEEGMPEEDQDGYDISRLSKPVHPIQPIHDKPLSRAPPRLDQPDVGDFINGRLNDADGDPTNCEGDELKCYDYEGSGSDAGTLSSLNSSSSGGDQDFDYLNSWGPKFGRLADMYGADGDDS